MWSFYCCRRSWKNESCFVFTFLFSFPHLEEAWTWSFDSGWLLWGVCRKAKPLQGPWRACQVPLSECLIDSTSQGQSPGSGTSIHVSPFNTDAASQDRTLRTADCVKVISLPGSQKLPFSFRSLGCEERVTISNFLMYTHSPLLRGLWWEVCLCVGKR